MNDLSLGCRVVDGFGQGNRAVPLMRRERSGGAIQDGVEGCRRVDGLELRLHFVARLALPKFGLLPQPSEPRNQRDLAPITVERVIRPLPWNLNSSPPATASLKAIDRITSLSRRASAERIDGLATLWAKATT